MNIGIMNKAAMREYANSPHGESAAVISIANHGEEFPKLLGYPENGIFAQCRVSFNDVEHGMENCITDADANKIAAFVNRIVGSAEKLIVQCEYGVSRSAGVAAAIMSALNGSDLPIFDNPRYRPNVTCYRKVMAAFNKDIDEGELTGKVAANRKLYETEMEKQ